MPSRISMFLGGGIAVAIGVAVAVSTRAGPDTRGPDTVADTITGDLFAALVPGAPSLANAATEAATFHAALVAAPASMELIDGVVTEVYAYNGAVPGPTLEVREGDRVVIRFRNDLPEPTTVHWHGLHLPVDSDGSPLDPVGPGEVRDYAFTIPKGTAGTYWYHPHPHHHTGRQVARGLYGAIIVRAEDDPLPAILPERLLILSDNRFGPDGSIDLSEPGTVQGRIDAENGREGDVFFVNGEVMPTLEIRSGEVQRWRVVNASAARVYRLSLEGHRLLHVGSDGGLFERPVEVDELLLANGERAELLVRGTGAPGTRATLRALPYDRYIPQTRPADWTEPRPLLSLQYTAESPVTAPPIPDRLRHVPPLDAGAAAVTRVVSMSQGFLNGQPMDMGRVDMEGELGATEVWEIENLVGMDHPFHLHGFQFQVLERNGVPEPYRSWKDTVNVPKHGTVRLVVRYENHAGRWMFHCHILDHEDQGMMGVLRINPGRRS